MTRGLTPGAEAAALAETGARTLAVELLFGSGPLRVVAGQQDVTIGGNLFTAVGTLGGVSVVEESRELRAYDLTLQLAGVPPDAVTIALNEPYQGRAGTVWAVILDPVTWQVVPDPVVIFRGRMDQMNAEVGESAVVRVGLRNRLADWERPRIRRYTQEDQALDFPTDSALRWVAATVEAQIVWPAGSWTPGSGQTDLATALAFSGAPFGRR